MSIHGDTIEYRYFSEIGADVLGDIIHPGQWALRISQKLKADCYINPPAGRDIFVPGEYADAGIRLGFTKISNLVYDTTKYKYEPNLSIIDVLMWLPPERIIDYFNSDKRGIDYCE